jgi:MoaA/NifB/PqqE/SkfB family radical SAM enzyme
VSIDGDQSTHDRIRRKGVFEKATAGIREIIRLPNRPRVAISTVITDVNYHELEKSYILAEAMGVDILNYNHLWIQTDRMVLDQQSHPDLPQSGRVAWQLSTQMIDSNSVYESLQSIRKKKPRVLLNEYPQLDREETRVYYHHPEQLVKVSSSRCAWQTMKIYPDGEVGICREHHAGNVQERPLREIWNNPRYRKFRRYLSEKGTCPICPRCCLLFSRM